MRIVVGEEDFVVAIADTDEKKAVGLSQLAKLPKGKGLVMKFDPPMQVPVRMSDMKFGLDLIFIGDGKVQKKVSAEAGVDDIIIGKQSEAVLEINLGEGNDIKPGMKVSYIGMKTKDGKVKMAEGGITAMGARQVLDEDGKNQMNMLGEERIVSRIDTKVLYKHAKAGDYKKLGAAMVKIINKQDTQEKQYAKN